MAIRSTTVLTIYSELEAFRPEPGSIYLYGTSAEGRSGHADMMRAEGLQVQFRRITNETASSFQLETNAVSITHALRNRAGLSQIFEAQANAHWYLDITGLSHHVWAPLLRGALYARARLTAVYIEPIDYRPSPNPREGDIFDLSSRITGIAPIPGFANFSEPIERGVCFVPLLGFEGARFAYLLEQVQPPGGKIVPVIGVPGFRPEYPFHTFQGNRAPLIDSRAWRNVKFARANCPFTVLTVLQDIATAYASDHLKIAPIGTKPHALGAVLFVLSTGGQAELVYDHPIRKPDRTSGSARLLRYPLHDFPIVREDSQ